MFCSNERMSFCELPFYCRVNSSLKRAEKHIIDAIVNIRKKRFSNCGMWGAMDPLALLWVHIVFAVSMLTAYKTFVGPLSEAMCEQYWQESCRYARLLGLTDATFPTNYAAVQQYIREAIPSGEIAIGPAALFIAQKVLYPPMPLLRKPLWMIVRLITIGQLPSDIRQAYGLHWSTRHRVGFRIARGIGHLLRCLFPNTLGRSPLVNFARSRVRGDLCQPTEPITSTNQG